MKTQSFGCSTLSVQNTEGGYLFGRNFDWNACDALVVTSYPQDGYASVSTVNMDFIRQGAGMADSLLSDEMMTMAALYAPLDGMNEKGLMCICQYDSGRGDYFAGYRQNGSYHYDSHPPAVKPGGHGGRSA